MQARKNARIPMERNNKERVQEVIAEMRSCQHDVDETGHFPTQQAIKAIIKKSENDSCVMKINKKCAAVSQYVYSPANRCTGFLTNLSGSWCQHLLI